jgi:hypothetical protein
VLIINTDGTVSCGSPLSTGFTSGTNPSTYTMSSFPFSGTCPSNPTPPAPQPNPPAGQPDKARSIADAAAILQALVGVDPRDPFISVGIVTNPLTTPLQADLKIFDAVGPGSSLRRVEPRPAGSTSRRKVRRVLLASSTTTIPAGQTVTQKPRRSSSARRSG